jgi:formylmethanofuran dehydrogenase subunit E
VELTRLYMGASLKEMFSCEASDSPPPRPARILQSLACDGCGEHAMESRTRRFGGRTLCLPCFELVEQKI